MKYKDYSEQDFIIDDYFQNWVLKPDNMSNKFWSNLISNHPEKKVTIERAAYFVRVLSKDNETLKEEEFDDLWLDIISNRSRSVSTTSIRRVKNGISYRRTKIIGLVATLVIGVLISRFILIGDKFNESVHDKDQITLELADGTVKYIDIRSSETVLKLSENQIIKKERNVLRYDSNTLLSPSNVSYNLLNVPFGKKMQLILSDGTHIFLNSGSKLRYPIKFLEGKPRNVFLDGEAFFVVKEDKERLFNVVTDQMNTQVYGTKFNVSSYNEDGVTSTVLVEGSVGVYEANNPKEQKLVKIVPGQRAVLNNNIIEVENVPIKKYVSWTEDKLYFMDDSFNTILKKLERHFNVEINNEYYNLNNIHFTGTFIDESLEEILKVCSTHTDFKYIIEDDKVTITENKY
ncbi:FecR family protein [Aestuariivivens sp. NBU2969]|uniref:FecR family protein n=1 Tax=Aestuariivivens sp. NBU2969 TaxID=2873267 RepID=UPI001CBFF7AD|nr:FecR family protein [Aestuariivivens sp. NBU2969]